MSNTDTTNAYVYGRDIASHGYDRDFIEACASMLDSRDVADELLRGYNDGIANRQKRIAEWLATHPN